MILLQKQMGRPLMRKTVLTILALATFLFLGYAGVFTLPAWIMPNYVIFEPLKMGYVLAALVGLSLYWIYYNAF